MGMTKIPNWSKAVTDGDVTHRWIHDSLAHNITIERDGLEWVMKLNGVQLKEAPTRNEIYDSTVTWLRQNSEMDDETRRLAEAATDDTVSV
jgi:hypothetical protein